MDARVNPFVDAAAVSSGFIDHSKEVEFHGVGARIEDLNDIDSDDEGFVNASGTPHSLGDSATKTPPQPPEAAAITTSTTSLSSTGDLLPPPAVAPQLTKNPRLQQRSRVINEILETERAYKRDLDVLVDCYFGPLTTYVKSAVAAGSGSGSKNNNGPSSQDLASITSIFGNVSGIRDLTADLLKGLEDESTGLEPGPVFLAHHKYLLVYEAYWSGFEASRTLLSELTTNAPWFAAFVAAVQLQPPHGNGTGNSKSNGNISSNKQPLASLLIKPAQRVPRYVLLLGELLKHTKEEKTKKAGEEAAAGIEGAGVGEARGDCDLFEGEERVHVTLKEAYVGVSQVAAKANKLMGEKAMQRRVGELATEWGVGFASVAGRTLVKEGVLTKTDRRGKPEALTFLLFTDLIVYGDVSLLGQRRVRSKFPLTDIMLIDNATVFTVEGSQSLKDVPVSLMTKEQQLEAAAEAKLDLSMVKGDEELTNFLQVLLLVLLMVVVGGGGCCSLYGWWWWWIGG
jgi:hypothetical protein